MIAVFCRFQLDQLKILREKNIHFSWHWLSDQLSPVWLTQFIWVGWWHTDQLSHFDLQPFVWPIVSEKRRRTAASHHRAHAVLFMQTLGPGVFAAAGQRSTSLFDHVCPPLASWMPFITLQSLNHRCAFEREKKTSLQPDWLLLVELLLRGVFHSVMDRCGSNHWATYQVNVSFTVHCHHVQCDKAAGICDDTPLNLRFWR